MDAKELGDKVRDYTDVEVTQEQLDNIEAAWRICAWGSGRRIMDSTWNGRFRESVAEVLGFEAPDNFRLVVA